MNQFSNIILETTNITIGKTNTKNKNKKVPWWDTECNIVIKAYKIDLNKF